MITSQSLKQLHSFVVSTDTNKASRASDSDGVKTTQNYYNRIVKQCKKLAQLVAISWLEHENSEQIRWIFLHFKNNDFQRQSQTYIDMVDLLTGKKGDLLEPWFPDKSFGAIFDQEEIDYFLLQVKWDTFEGSLQEIPQPSLEQKGPFFIMTLPYPPKPSAENVNLNDVPRAWLTSKVDVNNPNEIVSDPFPPVPYLPTTCS
ncbi:MAG: hypothetical protein IM473_12040 [Microcystis sp. M015S2]|uniref:hypothetical protein n=1 Tax=unclassified Microcystis TaxID=2643300 RepID=UPI00258F147B|nr:MULTISPECIES: hypothetical protein [unclassified Microcystis]MCA2712014.1 hypothetical protein [Microcystis sp. M025S2]MCA2743112.1 hypothetical protein [Microcystis sp. M015S2]MCA2758407.1 hypothetical protein [Microcystis sp. M145S2]